MATSSELSKDASVESNGNNQKLKTEFTEDEESLVARMFKLVGQRWHLIAGRIPGRTPEEIEKYWTSRHSNSRRRNH